MERNTAPPMSACYQVQVVVSGLVLIMGFFEFKHCVVEQSFSGSTSSSTVVFPSLGGSLKLGCGDAERFRNGSELVLTAFRHVNRTVGE